MSHHNVQIPIPEDAKESLINYQDPVELEEEDVIYPLKLEKIAKKTMRDKQNREKKKTTYSLPQEPDYEAILNAILPPREWKHDGKHYVQYVSHNEASREDVTSLQTNLDQKLLSRQARESGICPIRQELHSQCFDEIIRQVTIDCADRGLLLMRVRDELKMTIDSYETLYKSAVDFVMRKQVGSESGKKELKREIKKLESEEEILLKEVT